VQPSDGQARNRDAAVLLFAVVKRRLPALLLLSILFTSPAGMTLASVCDSPACCGCARTCPMHRSRKSQQEKLTCHGSNPAGRTCACGATQRTQPVVIPFAPKAILKACGIEFLPAPANETAVECPRALLPIRSIAPPDQPPRL
jgi:hypothetical protein